MQRDSLVDIDDGVVGCPLALGQVGGDGEDSHSHHYVGKSGAVDRKEVREVIAVDICRVTVFAKV